MARVIFEPEIPHDCYAELRTHLGGKFRDGTRAECSCGKVFVFFRRRKKLAWLYEFTNDFLYTYFKEEVRGWKPVDRLEGVPDYL